MVRLFLILGMAAALTGCKSDQQTQSRVSSHSTEVPAAMKGVEARRLFAAKPNGSAQSPAPWPGVVGVRARRERGMPSHAA